MANKRISNLTSKQIEQIKDLFKEELSHSKSIPFHTRGFILSSLNRAFKKSQLINNGLSLSKKDQQIKKIIQLRDDKKLSWHSIAEYIGGISHTTVQKWYNEYKQFVQSKERNNDNKI
jgi:DNA-binding transcriptional regulator YiaG